jgi:hypothetical protein
MNILTDWLFCTGISILTEYVYSLLLQLKREWDVRHPPQPVVQPSPTDHR